MVLHTKGENIRPVFLDSFKSVTILGKALEPLHVVFMTDVTLYIQYASNSVPVAVLISDMEGRRVNPWLLGLVETACVEMILVFRWGCCISESVHEFPGLPQGSSLSPVLFSVYSATGDQITVKALGTILTFADDIVIYRTGPNWQEMCRDIKKVL